MDTPVGLGLVSKQGTGIALSFSQAPLSCMGAGRECGESCDSLGLWFHKASTVHRGVGEARELKVNARKL